ncbi:MAG TPA: Ig-like domain-containing protein [Spirochaetota bacterium]|nr:Ig-like domain-containing protein [Spirochaetota bacterium]
MSNSFRNLFIFLIIAFIFNLFSSCQINPFFAMGTDVDSQYPRIKISSPGDTDYIGAVFTIKGTASDDKGLESVKISAKGMKDVILTSNLENWSVTLNVSDLPQGPNKFTATARDKTGKEMSTEVNVNLDKYGPVVNLLAPDTSDDNTIYVKGRVIFTGTVADDYQIMNNGKIRIYKKDNTSDVVFEKYLSVELGVWTGSGFDTMDPNVAVGLYILEVTFEDKLGNKTVWTRDLACAKEDDTPYIFIENPEPGANPKPETPKWFTFTGYAIDNRGITKVYYNILDEYSNPVFIDYQEIINDDGKPFFSFTKTLDLTNLDPSKTVGGKTSIPTGDYKISVYAKDNNNNTSSFAVSDFIFDNSIPDIRILDSSTTPVGQTPDQGAYLKGNFVVTVESLAPTQGKVVSYRIMQGGLVKLSGTMTTTSPPDPNAGKIYTATIDSTLLNNESCNMFFRVDRNAKFTEVSRVFYIDNVAPDITITSHTNNQDVQGAITLIGTANDNMGITKVEVYNPKTSSWEMATGKFIWSYVVSTDNINDDIETKYGVTPPNVVPKTYIARVTDRAGNTKTQNLTFNINPALDYPVVYLDAPDNNAKVSGILTVLGRIQDDDYPFKDMVANIRIVKVSNSSIVMQKSFNKNDQGFPNLSWIVDTSDPAFEDMAQYRIEIRGKDKTQQWENVGSMWHSKYATMVSRVFTIDKNAPIIEITSPTNYSYRTNSINFTGKVKDKNNLATTNSLILSYVHRDSSIKNLNINLTSATPEPPYNVWTFNVTMSGAGSGSGFKSPTTEDGIDWSNDEWGNTPHLFTFKATDETGLLGTNAIVVNLDNNTPNTSLTQPPNNYVIGYPPSGTINIKGTMDDTPPYGNVYPLDLRNIRVSLYQGSTLIRHIKDYNIPADNINFFGTPADWTIIWNYDNPPNPDGNYNIRYWGKDNAGNESLLKSVNIIKNSEPPYIDSITWTQKTYYSGIVNFTVVGKDRGSLPANGVTKLELLVNGVVRMTQNFSGNNLTETYVFALNSASLGLNGATEIAARVTDKTGITDTRSAGILYFDNTLPTINTPTYQTLGYAGNITQYTTYLGITVNVTDNLSLAGDNPQFKIGRTSGGNEIKDWTYFNNVTWNGESQYTAVYDNYIYVFNETGTLYITIKATDNAGNVKTQQFTITKGTLPALNFTKPDNAYISDKNDGTPNNNLIDITGTVESGTDKLWIKIDDRAEEEITGFTTTFSKSYTNAETPDGPHTFRIRSSKTGNQNIVTRTFIIDRTPPVITISDTVTPITNQGVVNGNNLSGKVRIYGTYQDNFSDNMNIADANIRIRINNGSWINLNTTANVTKNYGSAWNWWYDWDTETIAEMVKNNVPIDAECVDLANNSASTSRNNKNVVSYITTLASSNPSTYPVYQSKTYGASGFGYYENDKRYTMQQGTTLLINGYNLKYSTVNPTVKLGIYTLTVNSATKNQISVNIPTNDTDGKSGNINVTVQGITSNNVMAYVWRFNKVGDNYDTLDARDFDMSLTSGGLAFITFTRDHQVYPEYTGTANDYSTYRIIEGDTQAYNNYGYVDSIFFTANDIYDNWTYMACCIDEFTGIDTLVMKPAQLTDTTNYHVHAGGNDPYTKFNTTYQSEYYLCNTFKYGSVYIRKTGGGNGYVYIALYDDDARGGSIPVVPKLSLVSMQLNSYDLPWPSSTGQEITNSNNPGPWNAVAVTSGGYPVVSYYTAINNKLNLAYNLSSYTPTTFTVRTNLADGGKYNKMVINSSDLITIAYQNNTYDLAIAVFNDVTDTPSIITLETNAVEGVTGFNNSICYDSNSKPYVSYINNIELNLNSALHLARFVGTTANKANIANQSNWEYMKAPAPVGVQSANTVIKWDGTKPVIAFKANNYIYIGRLIQ